MDKRDFLFKFMPKRIRHQIRMDEEALYSVTDQITADKITHELLKYVPATAILTDGTACIGGNTFSFSRAFHLVNAVELDAQKFAFLKHNLNLFGTDNVHCIQGDILHHIQTLEQSLLFLDPPWGGPEYKQCEHIDLRLSDRPLSEVCRLCAPFTTFIALKTPTNFHLATFLEDTRDCLQWVASSTKLRKLHLHVFKTRLPSET